MYRCAVPLRQRLQASTLENIAMFLGAMAVLLARGVASLDRIPADQGYGIYQVAREDLTVRFVLGLNKYLNIGARLIPTVVGQFPVHWHAILGSLVTHLVWASCSLLIFSCVRSEGLSRVFSALVALFLVLVPHASESSLGNPGTVGFPLAASLIVLATFGNVIRHHVKLSALFALFVGVTTPFAFLALLPLLFRSFKLMQIPKCDLQFGSTILATLVLQVVTVGIGNATRGNSTKILSPWDGMGAFWWTGLLAPPILALFALLVTNLPFQKSQGEACVVNSLAASSLAFAILIYYWGGIADRFFVAPMFLSTAATLLLSRAFSRGKTRFVRVAIVGLLGVGLAIPTAKWFQASWYLTSGPTLTSEVRRARLACQSDTSALINLRVSPSGTVDLDCGYLK